MDKLTIWTGIYTILAAIIGASATLFAIRLQNKTKSLTVVQHDNMSVTRGIEEAGIGLFLLESNARVSSVVRSSITFKNRESVALGPIDLIVHPTYSSGKIISVSAETKSQLSKSSFSTTTEDGRTFCRLEHLNPKEEFSIHCFSTNGFGAGASFEVKEQGFTARFVSEADANRWKNLGVAALGDFIRVFLFGVVIGMLSLWFYGRAFGLL